MEGNTVSLSISELGIKHCSADMNTGRRFGPWAALLSLLLSLTCGGHVGPNSGFNLMGLPPPRRIQNRVTTAVTNSPIYYVKSPSLFHALLQNLVPKKQTVSTHKVSSGSMSVPLLSNAKPVGWYKLPGDRHKSKNKKKVKRPFNSPVIRLPTKMVANGRPHSVRRFKSPMDRFRLSNLLTMKSSGK